MVTYGHSGVWNFVDRNWVNNRQTPRLQTHTRLGSTCLSHRGEGSQSRLMWWQQRLRLKGCAECMCVFGGGALSLLPIRVWEYRCGFMRAPTWRWEFLLFFKSLFTFVHWHRKTPITNDFVAWRAQREGVSPFNFKSAARSSSDGNTFQWRAQLHNRPQFWNCSRVKWHVLGNCKLICKVTKMV